MARSVRDRASEGEAAVIGVLNIQIALAAGQSTLVSWSFIDARILATVVTDGINSFTLMQIPYEQAAKLDYSVRGRPQCFFSDLHNLTVWPVPEQDYKIMVTLVGEQNVVRFDPAWFAAYEAELERATHG